MKAPSKRITKSQIDDRANPTIRPIDRNIRLPSVILVTQSNARCGFGVPLPVWGAKRTSAMGANSHCVWAIPLGMSPSLLARAGQVIEDFGA